MDNSSNDLYDEPDDQHDTVATKDESEDSGEPFLAPKSAWGGKPIEVGEEYLFKVTGVHDAEVELVYSTAPSHKEEPAKKDESESLYE